ncbi:MAG: FkbM family methyltransferase [Verrucomicrobia bacterium]|nr:FkbM family methyltransferase [Verrucomicrobiota bacterium]
MLSDLAVAFYRVWHGTFHLPGSGWLLRRLAKIFARLREYPLVVAGLGTAELDFRDTSAYSLLNVTLGERDEHRALFTAAEKFLRPGAVFWDIGANVGVVAAHFAQPRFGLAAIHCFEPNPAPLKTLTGLFRNHPVARVHGFALGAADGRAPMNLSTDGSSVGSLHHLPSHAGGSIEIVVRAGDRARAELGLPAPNLMKIDVEGFEPEVLAGLAQTIAEARPVIFFEHIFLTDDQLRALVPPGYELWFLLDDGRATEDFARRNGTRDGILCPLERRAELVS